MKSKQLHDYCEILDKKIANLNISRLSSTYDDILILDSLCEQIENDIIKFGDFRKLYSSKNEKKIIAYQLKQNQCATLLRAIYTFSDIFVKILLGEITQLDSKSKGELSLINFIKNFSKIVPSTHQNILKQVALEKLLPVFCVVIYRNKIIIHHDKTRTMGFYHFGKGRQCRLINHPENGVPRETAIGLTFSKETESNFKNLWARSQNDILELSKKNKFKQFLFSWDDIEKQLKNGENIGKNIQIEMLFYNTPIGKLNNIDPDRFLINKIAEEGLCESMTREEIINALDIFIKEIVRLFK